MRLTLRLLLFLFLILSIKSYSQVNFEKGYFIDLNGNRTDCLIKNYDWKNNPDAFEYKLSEDDTPEKGFVSSISEFGIENKSKYRAIDVAIDRSSERLSELSPNRNPTWMKERLFLRVLLESKISLLFYADGDLKRFFYEVQDTVKQLVYKKYLDEATAAKVNYAFRQQLSADVKCGSTTDAELKKIRYEKSDLMRYFRAYNDCAGAGINDLSKSMTRGSFHMKIAPGVNYGTLMVHYDDGQQYYHLDKDFETQLDFRIGLESEYVLPYNKNKWAIVIEPSYQTFEAKDVNTRTSKATFNTFEVPLGLRYYLFLSKNSRIFINGLYVATFALNSSVELLGFNHEVSTRGGFVLGSGYSFKKFSGEIRYYKNKDILGDWLNWNGDFTRLSFILGYRIF